jgi:hypothetical protein
MELAVGDIHIRLDRLAEYAVFLGTVMISATYGVSMLAREVRKNRRPSEKRSSGREEFELTEYIGRMFITG